MKLNKKDIERFMNSVHTDDALTIEIECGDTSLPVEVKKYLSIDEKTMFINRVVNGCFDSNDEYHPEYSNVVFQITILQMMTNIPVFTKKIDLLDDYGTATGEKIDVIDMEKTFNLCRHLNLVERVQDNDFRNLCEMLQHYVNEKLAFVQQRILHGEKRLLEKTRSEIENGVELINGIAEKLNESLQNNLEQKDVLNTVSKFTERMDSMNDEQFMRTILES